MNILYIATDVYFPDTNGGSRRAYETARIFEKMGHNAYILADRRNNEETKEIIENITVYRAKLIDFGKILRKITNIKAKKPRYKKKILEKQDSMSKNQENTNYETFFPNLINYTLKYKIKDFYRHKFPLHKWLKIFPSFMKLIQIIKSENIDVIIERGPSYGVGSILSKLLNRIYVVDFIDIMYSNLALHTADLILSYFTVFQIPQKFDRNKVQRVYTSTDSEYFRPLLPDQKIVSEYGFSDKDFILIYIGAMYPWHGLTTIIKVAKTLKEQKISDIKFLLLGDGDIRNDLIQMTKDFEIEDLVKIPGRIQFSEVPKHLAIANVALSLNTGDSIGFKILEYMSSGKAIIATNADILHLIGKNRKELIVTQINDDEDLLQNILLLKNNDTLRATIGKNARNRVLEKYTWKHHYYNIVNGIKEVVKKQ